MAAWTKARTRSRSLTPREDSTPLDTSTPQASASSAAAPTLDGVNPPANNQWRAPRPRFRHGGVDQEKVLAPLFELVRGGTHGDGPDKPHAGVVHGLNVFRRAASVELDPLEAGFERGCDGIGGCLVAEDPDGGDTFRYMDQ